MNHLVMVAIEKRSRLKLRYYGHNRIVEPHAYGVDSRGDALLLCYQIAESGFAGGPVGWKHLRLYEAVSVAETEEQFTVPRSGYLRNDPAFDTIFAQL